MLQLDNPKRVLRLIESIIKDLDLDLSGIPVLTETGRGAFVVTPLIAALAGAEQVIAVTTDSPYGPAAQVLAYTRSWVDLIGKSGAIHTSTEPARTFAGDVELVTNLGFVRPIDANFVSRLPATAAISLMFEPWEFRSTDLDREACRQRGIPVLGTCETHPRLQIFHYVGLLALKLLHEAGLEVFKSHILVIGSGHFGRVTKQSLETNGAVVIHLDPCENWSDTLQTLDADGDNLDAVVLVEHATDRQLIGNQGGFSASELADRGIKLIHICGNLDDAHLEEYQVYKHPARQVDFGTMTVTTDYLGPRPVIDLHGAGLKVGEALVRGMRRYKDAAAAQKFALENSPALEFT